jgi:dynein heavy chain
MYPALINNTTIDWFMGWPEDALTEVALKFLHDLDGLPEDKIPGLARVASYAHTSTNKEA